MDYDSDIDDLLRASIIDTICEEQQTEEEEDELTPLEKLEEFVENALETNGIQLESGYYTLDDLTLLRQHEQPFIVEEILSMFELDEEDEEEAMDIIENLF